MTEEITRRDVLLAWALSEALSPRWAARYEDVLSGGFASSPDELSPVEQALLLQALNAERDWLIREYINPCTCFTLGLLKTADLPETIIMPYMTSSTQPNRVTLGKYIHGKFRPDHPTDPRVAARVMLENPTPVPYNGFPIIAWDARLECDVIIEGFARLISMLYRLEQGRAPEAVPVIFCRRS